MAVYWWFDTDLLGGKKKSKAAPALAEYGGLAHMVHLGNSSNDIWHSWFNGETWSGDVRIPGQTSKASPGLGRVRWAAAHGPSGQFIERHLAFLV
jgi:hypothetical protein